MATFSVGHPISGKLLEQPARDKKQIKNPLGDQYKEKQ